MFPAWMKPKIFQMQKMDGDLWTVPAVIRLQQLPVPKAVIVKSRFIIHSAYSFPYQLILLAMKLAGKIFKIGILMYGKNATPGEIWKWIRA